MVKSVQGGSPLAAALEYSLGAVVRNPKLMNPDESAIGRLLVTNVCAHCAALSGFSKSPMPCRPHVLAGKD